MILVISNKEDLTTDFIILSLKKNNIPFYRLNTEDLFTKININFDFSNKKYKLIDLTLNKTIDLTRDISSVYYRRPLLPEPLSFNISIEEKEFIEKESYYILEGLYSILKNKFWISYPAFVRSAENKILQLQVAQNLGFKIPLSLISNIKSSQNDFVKFNQSIIKPIKNGLITQNKENMKLVYVDSITSEKINLNKSLFPSYLQEKINKQYDLRLTVVGEKVIPVMIKGKNKNIIDWRNNDNSNLIYEKVEIPKNIEKMCVELLRELKLNFGAVDMALNTNGEYVFFEINPNGQWAWLDKQLHLNIANEIVNLLVLGGQNVR